MKFGLLLNINIIVQMDSSDFSSSGGSHEEQTVMRLSAVEAPPEVGRERAQEAWRLSMERRVSETENVMRALVTSVKSLSQKMDSFGSCLIQMREDMSIIKQETKELRQEVSDMKREMLTIREDVQGLKQEMRNVKIEVASIKVTIEYMKKDVNEIKEDVACVKKDITQLKQTVENIDETTKALKVAIQMISFNERTAAEARIALFQSNTSVTTADIADLMKKQGHAKRCLSQSLDKLLEIQQ